MMNLPPFPLVDWFAARRGTTTEECGQLLHQEPVVLATGLTRGQAEDVLVDVRQLGGTVRLRQGDGQLETYGQH